MSKKSGAAENGQTSLFTPPPPSAGDGPGAERPRRGQRRAETKSGGLELRPVVDAEMDAESAWLRASVEAFEPRMRELESRDEEAAAGPAAWTDRPQLACGWACACCESPLGEREILDLDRWPGGWRRWLGKVAGAEDRALSQRLQRTVADGTPVVLGAAADPYSGDSAARARTRRRLRALADLEGAEIAMTTASPLVLMDLELLVEIDQASSVSLEMVLPTVDPALARRLQPGTAPPGERLSALAEVADQGIVTRLRVAPLLPGLTDGEATLRPLFEAAAAAGVTDVAASPLALPLLPPTLRRSFFAWLAQEEPERVEPYRHLYRLRSTLRPADRRAVLSTFERLRLEYGFPRATASRG